MDTQDKGSSLNEVRIRSLDSFLNAIKDAAGRAKGTVMRPTDKMRKRGGMPYEHRVLLQGHRRSTFLRTRARHLAPPLIPHVA
jgi:hypothetical protein